MVSKVEYTQGEIDRVIDLIYVKCIQQLSLIEVSDSMSLEDCQKIVNDVVDTLFDVSYTLDKFPGESDND